MFVGELFSLSTHFPQDEFNNRRKRRSRRGNEAEVFSAPKSASYSGNEIKENARPHPGPLPQEREKLPPVLGNFHAQWRRTASWGLTSAATILANTPLETLDRAEMVFDSARV